MRKKYYLLIAFLFLFSIESFSQVAMKLELKRKKFIKYENVFAELKVRNMSSHPLVFGKNKDLSGVLEFDIRNNNGNRIKLRSDEAENLLYGRILKPGKIYTMAVSLSQMYSINKPGKYTAKAIIKHSQLESDYQSNVVKFTVTAGLLIWKTTVGVPTVDNLEKKKIIERDYEIRSYYDGMNKVYCLIVLDDDYVYGIARIGLDFGTKKPECLIDNYSRLHMLVKNTGGVYKYYVYDINCNLDMKETYEETKENSPTLELDHASGEVHVIGGKLILKK